MIIMRWVITFKPSSCLTVEEWLRWRLYGYHNITLLVIFRRDAQPPTNAAATFVIEFRVQFRDNWCSILIGWEWLFEFEKNPSRGLELRFCANFCNGYLSWITLQKPIQDGPKSITEDFRTSTSSMFQFKSWLCHIEIGPKSENRTWKYKTPSTHFYWDFFHTWRDLNAFSHNPLLSSFFQPIVVVYEGVVPEKKNPKASWSEAVNFFTTF